MKSAEDFADDFREWMVVNAQWPMLGDRNATKKLEQIIAARDAEWQARVDKLEAALEQIGFNGLQAYCTDRCLCAARDMRILARAALESARGK